MTQKARRISKTQKLDEVMLAKSEFQRSAMAARLNWLRAGVLGANDGIMSTSGMVLGVAAGSSATSDSSTAILVAGVAAVVAGSISMAGGEYTSVSAQKDSEKAALKIEAQELLDNPELELRELAFFYEEKGLSPAVAAQVAKELTAKDALKAHAEAEFGIDSDNHASPSQAAISSLIAFAVGGMLPLLSVTGPWLEYRIHATIVATVASLALTGYVGAKLGGAKPARGIIRNLVVSLLTMGITYAIGLLVGTTLV
jgi:VIT1/CCC1 family predicted Fe2+/Mn2+ transporter